MLIDFTRPKARWRIWPVPLPGVAAVIGTTGFTEAQRQRSPKSPVDIPIVLAPNMSVGVNVTLKLLEMAAKAGDGIRH